MASPSLEEKLRRLELLHRVGLSLSTEKNRDRLLETILLEAKDVCRADGGTLYLRTADDHLRFAIMRSDSLGIRLGGTTGKAIELPTIPMFDAETGLPNHGNVATYAASLKRSVNVGDAYDTQTFDFTGTKRFDDHHGYRSESFLTIPMLNHEDWVIGVLQLINARDSETGQVVPFSPEDQQLAEALASQAGIALHNQMLLEEQRILLESFIKVLAAAIDAKSPHTGGHCARVPVLAEMLVHAACEDSETFDAFDMTEEERYEFRIAAWLHDCGKVVTPPHVMEKSTKLETIFDRIHLVRDRFEILRRDEELEGWRALRSGAMTADEAAASLKARLAELDDDLAFLERVNIGSEFVADDDVQRIRRIAERRYRRGTEMVPLLGEDEVANLSVRRGTLTDAERIVINGHMVQTIRMLESLPFPRTLERVPEYAGGHHERMDAKGYPRGLHAGDMSIPARVMAVADVFEALTAKDRPYKPGKPLSEAMRIMGQMKRFNHLDPDLFDLFVRSGVYRVYAERFLSPEQVDAVDEDALTAIVPVPFETLPERERALRKETFLPEYEEQRHRSVRPPPVSTPPDWAPRSRK
jgi:HD-GYP domain-containing protein (c-di-GMP phosphodiesterase class II)